MTMALFRFRCCNGHFFDAPDVEGYGEFVARGERSNVPGWLQAMKDPVYLETKVLLEQLGAFGGLDERRQSRLLRSVFGITCDPAPDGSRPMVGRRQACPKCGTQQMSSWEPIAVYHGDFFVCTHSEWNGLSPSDKILRIKDELAAHSVQSVQSQVSPEEPPQKKDG